MQRLARLPCRFHGLQRVILRTSQTETCGVTALLRIRARGFCSNPFADFKGDGTDASQEHKDKMFTAAEDMFTNAQELSFGEWKATYENARDGAFSESDEQEQESGEDGGHQQAAEPGAMKLRSLSEREKREVYDLSVENPEIHTVAVLSQKFQTSVKSVRAILILQKHVREAEANGEIERPDLDSTPTYLETWDEYQEFLETLDEKERNQLKDGPVGRFKRAEDFEYFGSPPDEEDLAQEAKERVSDDDSTASESYPEFANEEQMEKLRKRMAMDRKLSEVEPPRKTIAPRLLDKNYGKSTDPAHRHKYKTLFQDITEASSKEESIKIMGVLDHDGKFRSATEEELSHRVKRLTPAKLKMSVKREIMTQKRHRLF